MFRYVFLSFILFFYSCTDHGPKQQKEDVTASQSLSLTALQVEPLLDKADKIEAIFYDNPDGDSLRYARFFRFISTDDTAVLHTLKKNLQEAVADEKKVRPFRSQGKLQLLKKEEAIKTIYFSRRCDSCCYLYFIRDGNFYYTRLTSQMNNSLEALEKKARKP